jgi:Tfp pilus assembly protein PilO
MTPGDSQLGKALAIDALAVTLCVILTAVVYFQGVSPLIGKQQHLRSQEVDLAKKRIAASQRAARLSELRRRLARTRQTLDASAVRLKSIDQLNQELAELTQLARECGLAVESVQPGRLIEGQRYGIVPVTLLGKGAYPKCAWFMHALTDQRKDTGIVRFELTGEAADAGARPGAVVATAPAAAPASFRIELAWYTAPGPVVAAADGKTQGER